MARGRARKGGKKGSSGPSGAPGARVNRIEKYEDTLEEGGVDDFMFKRDQIMFNPQDESDDDEIADEGVEVLSLDPKGKGKSRRAAAVEEDLEDDEEDDEEEEAPRKERKEKVKADNSKRGRFGKAIEDSDDSAAEGSGSSGSEGDEEGWGRQYYSRPSTRREREDPNAYDEKRQEEKELEEAEVKRLQRKAREELDAADWGLDGLDVGDEAVEDLSKEKGAAPPVEPVPETSDPTVLIQYLEKHEPVKIALAREWPLIVRKLEKTAKGIRKMEEEKDGQLFKGLGWLHYQTLLAYASTLAFYIHLSALPAESRPDLSSHPIVPRLLQLKEGLAMLEDLDFDAASVSAHPENPLGRLNVAGTGDDDEDDEELMELMRAKRELIARMQEANGAPDEEDEDESWRAQGLEDGELEALLRDAESDEDEDENEGDDDEEDEADDFDDLDIDLDDLEGLGDFEDLDEMPTKPTKSSQKNEKKKKSTQPSTSSAFVPLSEPAFVSTKSKKTKRAPQIDDRDLTGDLTVLSDADATDKAQRKRTLQFHTSKIASTVARREKARNTRLGGDEDVPYRDRQAARDAALRRNGGAPAEGEALDGKDDWSKEDRKRAREVREDADEDVEDDGYYNLVKRRKEDAKDQRKADHEAREVAHFAGFEDESAEGPRALTRAIEKNRGLTPRRNKASRNPRVKKRQAYEKAKKKVASQRAVFKGGQAALSGRYGGEKTGISTNIKSSRF